jgi:hypothetical protein
MIKTNTPELMNFFNSFGDVATPQASSNHSFERQSAAPLAHVMKIVTTVAGANCVSLCFSIYDTIP